MKQFKSVKHEEGAAADWDGIKAEAAKYRQAMITVEAWNEKRIISAQQIKWLHCKDGPIRIYSGIGYSLLEAENFLKRECGRQWFVEEINEDNWWETSGEAYYECRQSLCGQIFRPNLVKNLAGLLRCKHCGSTLIQLIVIKSKKSLSINDTSDWFENIFAFMKDIEHPVSPPDKEWRTNQRKADKAVK